MSKQVYISFSGGVESTTMLLRYGKGAKAIVVDPGDEEQEMYERWDFVEEAMKIIHNGDFELIRIKPEVPIKGKIARSLDEYALISGFFAGANSRYCTRLFKVGAIDDWLSDKGDCVLMIGLNADEDGLRPGNYEMMQNVEYLYPLVDDGLDRNDCIEELTAYGLQPSFPPYMSRGGCAKCFFRDKKSVKAKYIFNRPAFLKDLAFEVNMNEFGTRQLTKGGHKKFYAINANIPGGYMALMEEVEQEIAMFGLDELKRMYSYVPDHKTCGLFCHR